MSLPRRFLSAALSSLATRVAPAPEPPGWGPLVALTLVGGFWIWILKERADAADRMIGDAHRGIAAIKNQAEHTESTPAREQSTAADGNGPSPPAGPFGGVER